jgi:hypothetical protein
MTGIERRKLRDAYRYPGMEPAAFVEQHASDEKGWTIDLARRGKGGSARGAEGARAAMTSGACSCGTWTAADGTSTYVSI